jgi:predicted nuclease of predicted toxin-antitoxin system
VRFKLDENLPIEVVTALVDAGHEGDTAAEEGLAGAADPPLLAHCSAEGRVLVALDLDFANIRRHPPAKLSGLVVIRLRRQSKPRILAAVDRLLEVLPGDLAGKLCIVDETSIRLHD